MERHSVNRVWRRRGQRRRLLPLLLLGPAAVKECNGVSHPCQCPSRRPSLPAARYHRGA